jgi:hypothetical protein
MEGEALGTPEDPMTSLLPKLALVAALAAAAPAARAHDCDGDRGETASYAVPAQLPPDGAWRGEWRDRDWRYGDGRDGDWRGRGGGWRARELQQVRAQLRDLDGARARFYAERPRNRWETARFERWYGERRAELERRVDHLQPYAWR